MSDERVGALLRVVTRAVQDRAFFESLLDDPRGTLEENAADLHLTPDDVVEATEVVQDTVEEYGRASISARFPHDFPPGIWRHDFPIWKDFG